jgi:hypothetical protein
MRNRRKWISGLIAAAFLLGFVFWMRARPAPPPQSVAAAVSPPALPKPQAPRWPASMPTAKADAPKKVDHSGEIDVCGVGKVKLDRDDWTATGKYFDGLIKKSRMRWLSALRNSDDYRARAAGLYLEGMLDLDAPQKYSEAARDELVQLAVGTKDPAVYALAYTKCIKAGEDIVSPGACPQLSLDDWTRADSDNAIPWLQLAAKARREGDGAAEAAAFDHAARAHQYESYNWSLFSFAQAAIPGDVTAVDRWYLTTAVIGVEAAMPTPYQPLFQYCSRDAMADATARRQCNALAELMVNKATTLTEFSVGKSLGARVGWPAEVVDHLTQEMQASMQAILQMTPSDPDPEQQWNCDSVARGNAYMSEWDQLGERGLARQAIERSGETVAELSRKYNERMAKWARDAQSRDAQAREAQARDARASAETQPAAARP